MSKSTSTQAEVKAPKSIAVRELIPWMLVIVMSFSIAGIVTGWFVRSEAMPAPVVVEQSSKQ